MSIQHTRNRCRWVGFQVGVSTILEKHSNLLHLQCVSPTTGAIKTAAPNRHRQAKCTYIDIGCFAEVRTHSIFTIRLNEMRDTSPCLRCTERLLTPIRKNERRGAKKQHTFHCRACERTHQPKGKLNSNYQRRMMVYWCVADVNGLECVCMPCAIYRPTDSSRLQRCACMR